MPLESERVAIGKGQARRASQQAARCSAASGGGGGGGTADVNSSGRRRPAARCRPWQSPALADIILKWSGAMSGWLQVWRRTSCTAVCLRSVWNAVQMSKETPVNLSAGQR